MLPNMSPSVSSTTSAATDSGGVVLRVSASLAWASRRASHCSIVSTIVSLLSSCSTTALALTSVEPCRSSSLPLAISWSSGPTSSAPSIRPSSRQSVHSTKPFGCVLCWVATTGSNRATTMALARTVKLSAAPALSNTRMASCTPCCKYSSASWADVPCCEAWSSSLTTISPNTRSCRPPRAISRPLISPTNWHRCPSTSSLCPISTSRRSPWHLTPITYVTSCLFVRTWARGCKTECSKPAVADTASSRGVVGGFSWAGTGIVPMLASLARTSVRTRGSACCCTNMHSVSSAASCTVGASLPSSTVRHSPAAFSTNSATTGSDAQRSGPWSSRAIAAASRR
eukprot:comp23371_c0_seq1/m.38637 comp23371_c0_seq1/g.38637  ORF comp23371_c0_seq1/g.38637 comp23371_c0_seq1/m.38637 type:complete len:342 (+) comp23371_c0_seq1:2120-3145(+)